MLPKLKIEQLFFELFSTASQFIEKTEFAHSVCRHVPGLVVQLLNHLLMAGIVIVLVGMLANIFLQLPALHLAISAVFILISSGAILYETSNIIHGGETNYIRATVSLYVSLYNIFVSLLSILGFASRD